MLRLPKTSEEASKDFQNGDFAAAETKAQEWLKDDPFVVEAFNLLASTRSRQGKTDLADIVKAVLAINKDDTIANFVAATYTPDPEIAWTFLKHLEGTIYYAAATQNEALKFTDWQKRLGFLKSVPADIRLEMMKVQCYGALSQFKNAMDILSRDQFTKELKKSLMGKILFTLQSGPLTWV